MIAIVSAVADEPRDALVTTSVLNANVDAQCDKLAAVEVELSYYTCDDGHAVQNSATFGAKFPRKRWKQLILDIPEFPDNKVSRGGYTVPKCRSTEHRLVTDSHETDMWLVARYVVAYRRASKSYRVCSCTVADGPARCAAWRVVLRTRRSRGSV